MQAKISNILAKVRELYAKYGDFIFPILTILCLIGLALALKAASRPNQINITTPEPKIVLQKEEKEVKKDASEGCSVS